jgi:hypothetical protein
MTTNIIHALEDRLALPHLVKIDPNTSLQVDSTETNKLTQATVTAVLAGLYKYGRTEDGAAAILHKNNVNLDTIFNGNKTVVMNDISTYANAAPERVEGNMRDILGTAMMIVNENINNDPSPAAVKTYLGSQRHAILSYLPAELHLGDTVGDNTLDDRSNKMEGPISSFMHFIGSAFSGSSDEEQDNWKEQSKK